MAELSRAQIQTIRETAARGAFGGKHPAFGKTLSRGEQELVELDMIEVRAGKLYVTERGRAALIETHDNGGM